MATRTEYDATTGETIEIELNASEIAELKANSLEIEKNRKIEEAKAKADALAKQAILDRLGLTAEEAALLFK